MKAPKAATTAMMTGRAWAGMTVLRWETPFQRAEDRGALIRIKPGSGGVLESGRAAHRRVLAELKNLLAQGHGRGAVADQDQALAGV